MKLQAADNDFHRRDLWEAIDGGDFPEWEFAVQLFTEEEAAAFPFDHLDPTKLIPEELVPLQVIGRMVLDRNVRTISSPRPSRWRSAPPISCRASTSPTIRCCRAGCSPTWTRNCRALAGPTSTRSRSMHPSARSPTSSATATCRCRCPRAAWPTSQPALIRRIQRPARRQGTVHFAEPADGSKGRIRAESFADHFSQARMFFRSQSPLEQAHMASALVFELSKVETAARAPGRTGAAAECRCDAGATRWQRDWASTHLPAAAKPAAPVRNLDLSPALRIIDRMKPTLQGRCIGILVSEGTDMGSVNALTAAATKAGAKVKLVAPKVTIRDSKGKTIKIDGQLAGTPSTVFDAVASVLSLEEGKRLSKEGAAVDWFRDAFGHLKAIAACNGTRLILAAGGITPDAGVVKPEETAAFLKLAATRQWAREPQVRTLA